MRVKAKATGCEPIAVVPIHQRETYYCGPAVGGMVLRATGHAPVATDDQLQDLVWASVKVHSTGFPTMPPPSCQDGRIPLFFTQHCYMCNACSRCWASTADALSAALGSFGAASAVVRDGAFNHRRLFAAVLASIDQGQPAIVGTTAETHWVLISGYCPGGGTGSVTVNGRAIASFYLIDPSLEYPPTALDAKPAADVAASILFASCANAADMGNSLAIVRPAQVAASAQMQGDAESHGHGESHGDAIPAHPKISGPLNPVVIDVAVEIGTQLALQPQWQYAFGNATPGVPTPVQHLEEADGYYYIVDFSKDGGITGRLAIGGEPLRLLRINGVREAGAHFPPFVSLTPTISGREGKPFSESNSRVVRAGSVGVHPVLVWRNCAESRSVMLPFHVITVGDTLHYMRVDGRIFDKLTAGLPGH